VAWEHGKAAWVLSTEQCQSKEFTANVWNNIKMKDLSRPRAVNPGVDKVAAPV
jgi:hypothetical protein